MDFTHLDSRSRDFFEEIAKKIGLEKIGWYDSFSELPGEWEYQGGRPFYHPVDGKGEQYKNGDSYIVLYGFGEDTVLYVFNRNPQNKDLYIASILHFAKIEYPYTEGSYHWLDAPQCEYEERCNIGDFLDDVLNIKTSGLLDIDNEEDLRTAIFTLANQIKEDNIVDSHGIYPSDKIKFLLNVISYVKDPFGISLWKKSDCINKAMKYIIDAANELYNVDSDNFSEISGILRDNFYELSKKFEENFPDYNQYLRPDWGSDFAQILSLQMASYALVKMLPRGRSTPITTSDEDE